MIVVSLLYVLLCDVCISYNDAGHAGHAVWRGLYRMEVLVYIAQWFQRNERTH